MTTVDRARGAQGPAGPSVGGRRSRLPHRGATQRSRLVTAAGELTAELGWQTVGVHHVCDRAGVSRRTFYDLYRDREGCFLDAVQEAFDDLLRCIDGAVAAAGPEWEDRAVAATVTLTEELDADRVLAMLCIVAPLAGNRDALAIRSDAVSHVGRLLADAPDLPTLGEAVATGALGAVLELVHRRLTEEPDASLAELAGPAIYLVLVPFLGRRRARARAQAPRPAIEATRGRATSRELQPGRYAARELDTAITELARLTLEHLLIHPGARNIDLAHAIGVRHESQMSRHLVRLERAGLIAHERSGRAKLWQLTEQGRDIARQLGATGSPASTHITPHRPTAIKAA